MSFEDWLNMTDERLQELIASNAGYEIDNPFIGLDAKEVKEDDTIEVPDIEELVDPLPEEEIDKIKQELKKDFGEST